MNAITQCPSCQTRFRVSEEQLSAHDGMVRCGRCRAVFDARWHLQDNEPSPQLDLPIEAADTSIPPAPAQHVSPRLIPTEIIVEPALPEQGQGTPVEPLPDLSPVMNFDALEVHDNEAAALPEAPAPSRWGWALASVAGVLMLSLQLGYLYRTELAAQWPAAKPLLLQSCQWLGCGIGLPRQAEFMSIEASELEAVPGQPNRVILHALLRNRAPHVQDWPSLELTLTDLQDAPLARRSFHPVDYLNDKARLAEGLPALREHEVLLHLDTAELHPSGYRLLLYYPTSN